MKSPSRRRYFIAAGPLLWLSVLLLALALLSPPAVLADSYRQKYDTTSVAIVSDTGLLRDQITAYVADSPKDRYFGLSRFDSLADTRGMLFVYDNADTRTFVMRNMSFPLDMLFFGSTGRLTRIHAASVATSDSRTYRGFARWVLEVNRGWANRHNVAPTDRIVLPDN